MSSRLGTGDLHAALQVRLHLRPVLVRDRVVRRVADALDVGEHVLAEDALKARADSRERGPRALVARVGLELDADAAELVEGKAEHEQLRLVVRSRAPVLRAQPRVADLESIVLRAHGEI